MSDWMLMCLKYSQNVKCLFLRLCFGLSCLLYCVSVSIRGFIPAAPLLLRRGKKKVSQEDEWVILWSLNWNKQHPLTEPNGIKLLRWFALQYQRWRSRGCGLSNQMILSDVRADQRCGEWRWANNIQVKSFASLSLWAELIQLSSCCTVCVSGRTWLSEPLTLKKLQ